MIEILLVEESNDDAALTIHALKKGGLINSILHLKDGSEALDYLYCKGKYASQIFIEYPKVIFLDLKMPKNSGIEVLEKIKSDPLLKKIPVVILTPSKEDSDVKKCYELGANSYIIKPNDSDKLFILIKELGLYWLVINQPPL
ncbi:MAG: response regulator [Bacteroidetes bacterium]|nr:response regulator [Bacteroidota bacterium]